MILIKKYHGTKHYSPVLKRNVIIRKGDEERCEKLGLGYLLKYDKPVKKTAKPKKRVKNNSSTSEHTDSNGNGEKDA